MNIDLIGNARKVLDKAAAKISPDLSRFYPDFPKNDEHKLNLDDIGKALTGLEEHLKTWDIIDEQLIAASKTVRSILSDLHEFHATSYRLNNELTSVTWSRFAGNNQVWKWYAVLMEAEHAFIDDYNEACAVVDPKNEGNALFAEIHERSGFDGRAIDFLERFKEVLLNHGGGELWSGRMKEKVERAHALLSDGLNCVDSYLQLRRALLDNISTLNSLLDNLKPKID